jgi:hypothetical protein
MSTASLALGRGKEDRATEIFHDALKWAISNAETAAAEARQYKTIQQWHGSLLARVSVAAAGTSAIPGLHGGGIVLELPYLFRLMARGAIGTGELVGARIEAEDDLLAIFALWSGAISKSALAAAPGGVVIVDSIAYPAFGAKVLALGFKIGVKAAAANVGGVAGLAIKTSAVPASHMLQPIIAKILAKVSAKISAKFGTKALAGFVPLLGAVVSIGISLYILDEFLTSAKHYYDYKVKDTRSP